MILCFSFSCFWLYYLDVEASVKIRMNFSSSSCFWLSFSPVSEEEGCLAQKNEFKEQNLIKFCSSNFKSKIIAKKHEKNPVMWYCISGLINPLLKLLYIYLILIFIQGGNITCFAPVLTMRNTSKNKHGKS